MDETKNLLEGARVPDPGNAYWDTFPDRVLDSLGENRHAVAKIDPARRIGILRLAFTSAAVVSALFTLMVAVRPSPPLLLPGVAPIIVTEARRTTRLAGETAVDGVLPLLERAAVDKVHKAQAAAREGNWEAIPPLARSYEMILKGGILKSLDKAVEEDEDVAECVAILRDSTADRAGKWQRLADTAADPELIEALEGAVEASNALIEILNTRFAEERG